MKKIFIIVFAFLAMSVGAQNSFLFPAEKTQELYCYNLSSEDLQEFNQNMDLYKEHIREILRKEKNEIFSMIVQSEQVFMVIVISIDPAKEASFLYNSSNKELKILSLDNFMNIQEKTVRNTLMTRSGSSITLSTLSFKFVIRQVEDLFGQMGIRSLVPLSGAI